MKEFELTHLEKFWNESIILKGIYIVTFGGILEMN